MYCSSQQTKNRLIEAGGKLAAERGIDNISLRQIASAAGENIGSIQYHFGSKEGFLLAIIETALQPWVEKPLSAYIVPFMQNLDSAQGQAEAIRAIIHYHIIIMFRSEYDSWYINVLFNILQTNNKLNQLFYEKVMNPDEIILQTIIKKAKPEMSDLQLFIYSRNILAPFVIQVNLKKFFQGLLKTDHYTEEYITNLEELIVEQTLLGLGLPLEQDTK